MVLAQKIILPTFIYSVIYGFNEEAILQLFDRVTEFIDCFVLWCHFVN